MSYNNNTPCNNNISNNCIIILMFSEEIEDVSLFSEEFLVQDDVVRAKA